MSLCSYCLYQFFVYFNLLPASMLNYNLKDIIFVLMIYSIMMVALSDIMVSSSLVNIIIAIFIHSANLYLCCNAIDHHDRGLKLCAVNVIELFLGLGLEKFIVFFGWVIFMLSCNFGIL